MPDGPAEEPAEPTESAQSSAQPTPPTDATERAATAARSYLDAQRAAAAARERAHWGQDPARLAYHAAAQQVRESLDVLDAAVRAWQPDPDRTARKADGAALPADALEELIAEATDRLAHLQEVTSALARSLTPGQVAEVAVTQAVTAVGALAASLVVTETPDGTPEEPADKANEATATGDRILTLVASHGYPPESLRSWQRLPLSTPVPLADAVRTAEPVFVESREALLARAPALATSITGGADAREGAWAALPLLAGDQAIGALGLAFEEPRTFDEDDRGFLITLAGQVALALARANFYAEAERRREQTIAIVESITDAFLALDRSWRVIYANHGAERHFGRDRSELIGRTITDFAPGVSGSPVAGYYQRVMDEGTAAHFETVSAVTGRWIEVHAYPHRAGIVIYFQDITERKETERRLAEQDSRERAFFREVLLSASQGRLHLCATTADLPEPLAPVGEPIDLTPPTLSALRARIGAAAAGQGLSEDRAFDLITAAGEVAMNAITHAGGGSAQVGAGEGRVQVRVQDRGRGIAVADLPRATLARGYSTRGTLGHGFHLVLSTADQVWLLTGPIGTTVVIDQDHTPPLPAWVRDLEAAPSLTTEPNDPDDSSAEAPQSV
jgi:PAS domain S-box-containing protein